MLEGLCRVLPGDAAVQMLQQMKPGGFEFVTDKPQPKEPGSEGIFLVGASGFLAAGAPLVESLRGDGKAELDVCLDLACVSGGIKQPELDSALLEHAVQVQAVVSAVVVMLAVTVAAVVPDTADLVQGFRLFTIDFIQKALLHLLAILPLPCHLHLHGLVDQILLGSHDVGDVSQSVGVVGRGVQVDVDTATFICNHSSLPKLANNLLYGFDVLIAADGTDQLHAVGVICRYN